MSEAGGNFQIFLFFLQSRSIIILCALGPHFPLQRGIEKKKKKKIVTSFLLKRLISQFKLNIINRTSIQSVKYCYREVRRFWLASRHASAWGKWDEGDSLLSRQGFYFIVSVHGKRSPLIEKILASSYCGTACLAAWPYMLCKNIPWKGC